MHYMVLDIFLIIRNFIKTSIAKLLSLTIRLFLILYTLWQWCRIQLVLLEAGLLKHHLVELLNKHILQTLQILMICAKNANLLLMKVATLLFSQKEHVLLGTEEITTKKELQELLYSVIAMFNLF